LRIYLKIYRDEAYVLNEADLRTKVDSEDQKKAPAPVDRAGAFSTRVGP
jgi:hypothetical protein